MRSTRARATLRTPRTGSARSPDLENRRCRLDWRSLGVTLAPAIRSAPRAEPPTWRSPPCSGERPMDMRVDPKRIRAERERRAWSQEHLATVSGLGLRTIQRIEKTGAASFESARALAAVLEVSVAELRVLRDDA